MTLLTILTGHAAYFNSILKKGLIAGGMSLHCWSTRSMAMKAMGWSSLSEWSRKSPRLAQKRQRNRKRAGPPDYRLFAMTNDLEGRILELLQKTTKAATPGYVVYHLNVPWETALRVMLQMSLRGEHKAMETTHGFVFLAKQAEARGGKEESRKSKVIYSITMSNLNLTGVKGAEVPFRKGAPYRNIYTLMVDMVYCPKRLCLWNVGETLVDG